MWRAVHSSGLSLPPRLRYFRGLWGIEARRGVQSEHTPDPSLGPGPDLCEGPAVLGRGMSPPSPLTEGSLVRVRVGSESGALGVWSADGGPPGGWGVHRAHLTDPHTGTEQC